MTEPVMVGDAPAAASNRRALIMLGVAAAVLALVALVLPKVLFGSDDLAADDFADVPAPAVEAPVVADADLDADVEAATSFQVFSTRNPFTPLKDLTGAGAATSDVAPVVAGTDTAPAPEAGATGGTVTEPAIGQRIALLEVFVDDAASTVASVRVNDTVHEVAEGASFASRYQAVTLSVADGCGEFLDGDTPFRLCEGDELLK